MLFLMDQTFIVLPLKETLFFSPFLLINSTPPQKRSCNLKLKVNLSFSRTQALGKFKSVPIHRKIMRALSITLALILGLIFKANSIFIVPSCNLTDADCNDNESDARKYVESLDKLFLDDSARVNIASWKYSTNITDANSDKSSEMELESAKFTKEISAKLRKFKWDSFKDKDLARLATAYFVRGVDIPDETYKKVMKH